MTDRWLIVWFKDGGFCRVRECSEQDLRSGVERLLGAGAPWVDSDARDSLIELRTLVGAVLTVPASSIACWSTCTPESRRAEADVDRFVEGERAAWSQPESGEPAAKEG